MTTYIKFDPLVHNQPAMTELLLHSHNHSDDVHRQVGAAILRGKKVVSLGTNHASGYAACVPWANRAFVRSVVMHAEIDAILSAMQEGFKDWTRATLMVSLEPCQNCRNVIEMLGIPEVIFFEEYIPSDSKR